MNARAHIASVMPIRRAALPSEHLQHAAREEFVRRMAFHLVAGASIGLDLSSDFDVIRYLKCETHENYLARTITAHMDAARDLARETIEAAKEGLR